MKKIACNVHMAGIRLLRALAGAGVLALAGCVGVQVHPASNVRSISLAAGELEAHGIAFITPTTTTGREEEKQAVAHVFGETIKRERAAIKVITLPETLSAINKADLADPYRRMYDEQRDTGVFQRAMLAQVGKITGSRYIAQIKLQEFTEGSKERFSLFSLRLVETSYARVRVFLQVWDSRDGSIAWEGMQELTYAHERVSEKPVTFQTVVDHAAQRLVARLP